MIRAAAVFAGLSGFFAVALGAFGAHGLRNQVSPSMLDVWQTAVLYQMFHSLALLAVVIFWLRQNSRCLRFAAIFFGLGMAVFSGSLYGLVLSGITQLGMITPLGGVMLLAGWACFTATLFTLKPGRF